jgi:serine/threonine protein kinase
MQASTLVIAAKLASKNLLERLHECRKEQGGEGGIPLPELLVYIRQSAEAIDHLNAPIHQLGDRLVSIQHRDIKPENILLSANTVKVTDFGLAKVMEGASAVIHGYSAGLTLSYAAPEVFSNKVTAWSDQYSLAVTYFHLRTGTLPFRASAPTQIFIIHVEGKLELNPLPEAERAVIARATAVDPTKRFPSCKEMVRALEDACGLYEGGSRAAMQWSVDLNLPGAESKLAPDTGQRGSPRPTDPAEESPSKPKAPSGPKPSSSPKLPRSTPDAPPGSKPGGSGTVPTVDVPKQPSGPPPSDPHSRAPRKPEDNPYVTITSGPPPAAVAQAAELQPETPAEGVAPEETGRVPPVFVPKPPSNEVTLIPSISAPWPSLDDTLVDEKQEAKKEGVQPSLTAYLIDAQNAQEPKSWRMEEPEPKSWRTRDVTVSTPPSQPRMIQRHTNVSFAAKVPVGKVRTLKVRLVPTEQLLPGGRVRQLSRPHPHDATMLLEVSPPNRPGETVPPIRLTITVAAENFRIEGSSQAELVVPLIGKSDTVRFRLRGEQCGPGRIMVDFSQNGRPVGSVDLYPEVVKGFLTRFPPWVGCCLVWVALSLDGTPQVWAVPSPRESPARTRPIWIALDASHFYWAGSLFLVGSLALLGSVWRLTHKPPLARIDGDRNLALHNPPLPAPDVVIKVFELRYADRPGRLHFHLFSTHPQLQDLPVLDGDLGTCDLKSEAAAWVENQLRVVGQAVQCYAEPAEAVNKVLSDVGYQLYEQLLPEKLQELCWTLRQRGVKTVLILSDEPHIPWELIKPFRANRSSGQFEKVDEFWGEAFAMSHWLRGRPPAQQLALRRVVAVATGGSRAGEGPATPRDLEMVSAETSSAAPVTEPPSSPAIGYADEELAILRTLESAGAQVQILPARRQQLCEILERGEFDLLHLACHGTFAGVGMADASCLLMEDGTFSAAELSPRLAGKLQAAAPLIFMNACHSGRLGYSLTRLGSWGARLVQLGCGGFVGSLWPVTDLAAVLFARAFYALAAQGLPLAEVVLQARHQVRTQCPGDPSWLAYCCFADPLARFTGSSKAPPRSPALSS